MATNSPEISGEEPPKPVMSIEYPPPPSKNRDLLEYVVKKNDGATQVVLRNEVRS